MSHATPERGSLTASSQRGRPLVLIVDDELHHLELLGDVLADEYETLAAEDGIDALRKAEQMRPDLIMLDVCMPGLSGFEVCRQLKELEATRQIPLIFITGFGETADETCGLSLGAVDYVTKPINPPSILARVKNQIRLQQAQREIVSLVQRESQMQLDAMRQRADALARSKQEELKLKDDFLAHISHELRTPLSAIHGFCSLLVDGLAGKITAEQKRHLLIVLRNVQHLQEMIEDLLQITEAQSGKINLHFERVSAGSTIEFAEQTLQPAARAKGVRLSSKSGENLPFAVADPQRLRQILLILIDNAIKFTPQGGQVTVSVGVSPKHHGLLLFGVADNGCGIEPALRTRIFEHLFQVSVTDRRGRSRLGLGLSIARNLVEGHGGEIWVEGQKKGSGSRFLFTMPAITN